MNGSDDRPRAPASPGSSLGLNSARSTPTSSRRSSKSIPAKLPKLEIEPAFPASCDEDVVLPETPCAGHVRMLQGMRRSTPQVRTSWPPSAPGGRVPLTSGAGWGAPTLAPLPPSAPLPPTAKCRPRRQSTGKARSAVDSVAMETPAAPAPAEIEPPLPTEEQHVLRPGSAKVRSQSEAPACQATPQVKRQAVNALQKFFFEELQKGNDPSGAAAQALLRLNELASAEQEKEASLETQAPEVVETPGVQAHVSLGSPPRPPTPLVGGSRGRRAIRVSNKF